MNSLKSFSEFINESVQINYVSRQVRLHTAEHLYDVAKFSSKQLPSEMKNHFIGTIGYKNVYYDLYELSNEEKREFGAKDVFAVSSSNMINQIQSIVKIKGSTVYFLDNDEYADNNVVKFDPSGVKLEFITIKNPRYNELFAQR